jgi:Ca-activated chloride channel family protein
MSFIWPPLLLSLLGVPLLVLLLRRWQQRRQLALAHFAPAGLVQPGGRIHLRRRVLTALMLLGLTTLLVALARPQAVVTVPRAAGTVVLAFDISGSMAAEDMPPTRMEAAKAAANDFVQQQPPGVRIGVVAFSDNGVAVQVPTHDREAVLAAIARLRPQRGTSLASGLLAAIKVLETGQQPRLYSNRTATPQSNPTPMPVGTDRSAAIVLLSDGDNNEPPDPLAAAQAAADRGIRVYTVGLGSTSGTTLRINGFLVYTQLNAAMLQQIARQTDGAYFNVADEQDLRAIYDNLSRQLALEPEATEMTAMVAGLGLLLLLLGGGLSLLWFGRVP